MQTMQIDKETKQQQQTKQKARLRANCLLAALNIQNNKYSRLYANGAMLPHDPYFHRQNSLFSAGGMGMEGTEFTTELIASFKHSNNKKPQEKLVQMHFLKDSNYVILGYDKQTDRGDINFIAVNELSNKDFYYNRLATGIGGIQCFQDGRTILIADKKGSFSFIEMLKDLDHNDIAGKKIDTGIDGVLDVGLGPAQNKIVCGLADKRCVVLDIEKQRKNKKFVPCKTFDRHIYSVNSVNWHPYKSLVVSSSIHLSDTVKLWDPHSEQLVHQTKMHKSIVTKVLFHPEGNTYFSLGKDNTVVQNQLRKRGSLNTFTLQFEPTHLQVLRSNHIVISDSGGYMNWFTGQGQLTERSSGGASGVSLFTVDQTNNLMVVGREREHMFEIYGKRGAMKINRRL